MQTANGREDVFSLTSAVHLTGSLKLACSVGQHADVVAVLGRWWVVCPGRAGGLVMTVAAKVLRRA
jgi:hypothetical protein